jgi:hypothetical protein
MPVKRLSRGQQRSLVISRELGQCIVATSNDSFAELEPKFKALQRRLVAGAASESERHEIRRRIAEELVNAAFGLNCPWPIFGRALRRIQQLGYTDVERRYHIAALFALWCQQHPRHAPEAGRLLNEAERRLRRLPRRHLYRTELLTQLEELRARIGLRIKHSGPSRPSRKGGST